MSFLCGITKCRFLHSLRSLLGASMSHETLVICEDTRHCLLVLIQISSHGNLAVNKSLWTSQHDPCHQITKTNMVWNSALVKFAKLIWVVLVGSYCAHLIGRKFVKLAVLLFNGVAREKAGFFSTVTETNHLHVNILYRKVRKHIFFHRTVLNSISITHIVKGNSGKWCEKFRMPRSCILRCNYLDKDRPKLIQ